MKRQTVYTLSRAMSGIAAALCLPFLLAGCGGKSEEKPAAGYPGGQKAGAVVNMTNEPGYNTKGGATGAAGGKTGSPSGSTPTSGGH